MKKTTLILFSLIVTIGLNAQEVVSTQGDHYTNPNGSVSFTVGEVVINTGTDGINDITQGFHQTKWMFVGLEDHSNDFEATIYPNPSQDVLYIKTSTPDNVSYIVYDFKGRLVLEDNLSSNQTSIEVGGLAPGNYSLVLSDKHQALKTFKLIKTN